MKKDWTEIAREKLMESQATPPGHLWAGISSELDAISPTQPQHKPLVAWRWLAAVACLAIAVTCGVHFIISDRDSENMKNDTVAINQATAQSSKAKSYPKDTKDEARPTSNPKFVNEPSKTCPSSAITSYDAEKHENDGPQQLDKEAETPIENPISETADTSANEKLTIEHALLSASAQSFAYNQKSKSANPISISLYASNTNLPSLGNNMMDPNQGDNLSISTAPGFVSMGTSNSELDYSEASAYFLKEATHRQPMRFGLSVRMPISTTISINSGIVYSRLSSSLTWSNSKGRSVETEQSLNYIGIPISIDYNIASYHSTSFYLTGGAMAEKCVYGESHLLDSSASERVDEKTLQISLFAGAGAQINLAKHFSIYAEPLATFYIDNHSDVTNIYKDRPINFDLRIGLRYTMK